MLSTLLVSAAFVVSPVELPPYLEANLPHYTDEIVAKHEEVERERREREEKEREASTTPQAVEKLIKEVFGKNAKTALAIAKCESNLVATATAKTKKEDSRGIFQINTYAHKDPDPLKLYEPEYNIRFAKKLFEKKGWEPWTCWGILSTGSGL